MVVVEAVPPGTCACARTRSKWPRRPKANIGPVKCASSYTTPAKQIKPLLQEFKRDEVERKLRSDLDELQRKYEKEHETLAELEAKVLELEKSRDELEENLKATESVLQETRESQNRIEEDRRKLQVMFTCQPACCQPSA